MPKYNRRIIIERKTTTYNAYNEPIDAWATNQTLWAGIVTSGGGEFYAAQKINAQTTAVFKIRYNTTITTVDRIKYGTRIFQILSINDVDARHEEMFISAKEVV